MLIFSKTARPISINFIRLYKQWIVQVVIQQACTAIYTNSVRTSWETHYVSATKLNRLMLFRQTVAVYCENHMEHTNILCGQKTQSVPHRKHIMFP
jgi:hypothetical protein